MKLVVFCLVAVYCCSLASASTSGTDRSQQRRKLGEILRQLNDVKLNQQPNESMLRTPPQNIEDCCCLSALQCFRVNLHMQLNATDLSQRKLYRSLKHPITERGLTFCGSGNSICQDCDSHPKENAREFFNRLESLIQRAIARLSIN